VLPRLINSPTVPFIHNNSTDGGVPESQALKRNKLTGRATRGSKRPLNRIHCLSLKTLSSNALLKIACMFFFGVFVQYPVARIQPTLLVLDFVDKLGQILRLSYFITFCFLKLRQVSSRDRGGQRQTSSSRSSESCHGLGLD